MVDSTITRWLKAMNPLHKPADRAEAERSARSMAIGLFLSVIASIPGFTWMFSADNLVAMMDQQYAAMGLSADDIAIQQAMLDTMLPYALGFGVLVSVVVYAALGFAQWRYMTRAIPIVMLGLSLYGLVSSAGMHLLGAVPTADIPIALTLFSWVSAALTAVIYVASLQGAIMLHRLRGGA